MDGYFVDIMHIETGASYKFTRDIGCRGSQLVRAVVGTLEPGFYRFTLWALNLAGASVPIEIAICACGTKRLVDLSVSSEVNDSSSISPGCTWRIIVPSHPQHAKGLASSDTHTTTFTQQLSPIQNRRGATPIRRALPQMSPFASLHSVASQAHEITTQANMVTTPRRLVLRQLSPSERVRSFSSQANTLASRVESLCSCGTQPGSTPSQQHRVGIRPISRNSALGSVGCIKRVAPKVAINCQGATRAGTSTRAGRNKVDVPASDENACVICLSEHKTHAFMPCGHLCVCRSCGQAVLRLPPSLVACPMCRVMVVNAIHIYT